MNNNRHICAEDFQIILHNSLLLNYELHIVTFFQIVQYERGKKKLSLQWRSLTNTQPGDQG